ncbi:hypothetical protein PoMZ_06989 [Pyricularia oryzae]|uniref:Uncharacterized protein n=1 Tax=Pyricularia oryzae TaxID=318829 RepID=A0A4P7NSK6_PYROR|nr:hypothetical protein PoMZ_06989 [Pyricularia oryzae]
MAAGGFYLGLLVEACSDAWFWSVRQLVTVVASHNDLAAVRRDQRGVPSLVLGVGKRHRDRFRLPRPQTERLRQLHVGHHVLGLQLGELLDAPAVDDEVVQLKDLEPGGRLEREAVRHGGGAIVGDGDVMDALEVCRVVEVELGGVQRRGGAQHPRRVDQPAAHLQRGRHELGAGGGAVVPRQRGARARDAPGQLGGEGGPVPVAAAQRANVQRRDAGDVGRGHGRAALHHVRVLGPGAEDVAAGGRDVGLELQVVGRRPAAEDAGLAAGREVRDPGQGRVSRVQGKVGRHVGAGDQRLDDGVAGLGGDHAQEAARVRGAGRDDGPVVVVHEHVLGAQGLQVFLFAHKVAAGRAADERHGSGQVGGSGGVGAAGVVGVAGVEVEGHDGPAVDLGGKCGGRGKVSRLGGVGHAVAGHGQTVGGGGVVACADGCDGQEVRAGVGVACIVGPVGTVVAGRHGHDDALGDEAGCQDGQGVVGPSGQAADAHGDDVGAVAVGAQPGVDDGGHVGARLGRHDLVGEDGGVGRHAHKLVAGARHDARHVGAVPDARRVERVIVGARSLVTPGVAHKIPSAGDLEAGAEATPERGMLVPDAAVDHGDLDALAQDALGVQPVDARGRVHRVVCGGHVVGKRALVQGLVELDALVAPDVGRTVGRRKGGRLLFAGGLDDGAGEDAGRVERLDHLYGAVDRQVARDDALTENGQDDSSHAQHIDLNL